ncbi:MAG: hypothetical protein ACRD4Q_02450 [Candidatus Acidiferrales bacterium]
MPLLKQFRPGFLKLRPLALHLGDLVEELASPLSDALRTFLAPTAAVLRKAGAARLAFGLAVVIQPVALEALLERATAVLLKTRAA